MKIGIFGGCFNPPHQMHKSIANNLIINHYVDKVIYVPTGNKYNKKDLVGAKDRYNMIKLMIEGNNNLDVSDYEIKNTLTYTYQTLNYFKDKYRDDEIYFICGSDNLNDITTWKNYEYILNNFKILVVRRDDDNIDEMLKNNKNVILVNMPMSNLSSTEIRKLLKNHHQDELLTKLDEAVIKYINENELYF